MGDAPRVGEGTLTKGYSSNQSVLKSESTDSHRFVAYLHSPLSQKRLNQQKRQHERERKELEQLKRSHLINVRVVQRNLVYVTGMGSRFAKEEVSLLSPNLRHN